MSDLIKKYDGPGTGSLSSLLRAMHFIVILSGCIMALTFFFVVILRYGFDADLFAYEEWLLAVAFWMFFMASAVATHNEAHITADILGILLENPKTIWLRSLFIKTIELIILLFLTYLGFVMILEDLMLFPKWQTTIALKIPFIVPRLGIFLGFLMMTIFTVLSLIVLAKTGPESAVETEQVPEAE